MLGLNLVLGLMIDFGDGLAGADQDWLQQLGDLQKVEAGWLFWLGQGIISGYAETEDSPMELDGGRHAIGDRSCADSRRPRC